MDNSDKQIQLPVEVEKPPDFPTSSEPLIKAWSVERTPHAFILATARLLTAIKNESRSKLNKQVRPIRFLLNDYLPEHYKNRTGSKRG
ncbi:hypothetical protein HPE56_16005 [Maribacter sp. ANRC-HE7]|uniref:Uncharacterized protein n=1 Tax=Maribacter aquimaris TaxID=2737171 RepID=A0ABR7V4K5_9FLAO|nr:hypothetical protein [Maribacter aquimaris]MBD0779305.1 hypothetical protein [Maribacter aquimaris]